MEGINKKAFYGVVLTQIIASFIEFAMRLMVFTLATRPLIATQSESFQHVATNSAFAFLIPMLFFCFPAGLLVDYFCKRKLIIISKILDILILAITSIYLYYDPHNILVPFIMLGFLGISGALFNPAKGSLLPEILDSKRLGWGNGLLEMWTMLSVFAGNAFGPAILAPDQGGLRDYLTWIGPFFLTLLASVSLIVSISLPRTQVAAREGGEKFFKKIKQALKSISNDPSLAVMLVGNVLFWIVISYFGQNVLVETKNMVIHWENNELWQGIPLAAYWFGIAIGSLKGGKLPVDRISKGPKTLAVLWFTLIWFFFRIIQPGFFGSSVVLALMGLAAGYLLVPIMAIIQHRSPRSQRGFILSFNNAFNIFGILLGSYLALLIG